MNIGNRLKKYFQNQLSAEERLETENWLLDPSNKETILALIEEGYITETDVASVVPFDLVWQNIKNSNKKGKLAFLTDKWVWAACAACIVFLLGGMWFGYHLDSISGDHQWRINTSANSSNEFARVTLSDGSEVILAANSSLSFDKDMKVNQTLYLDGAAYFEFGNSKRNYTIKTKNVTTTTKKSKINITAFSKDSLVKVEVKKGKAEVSQTISIPMTKILPAKKVSGSDPDKIFTINANEEVTFDKNSKTANIEKVDPNSSPLLKLYPTVKDQNNASLIQFNHASILQITGMMKNKYNLEFDVTLSNPNDYLYTGNFNADENPFNILIVVCQKMGLTFKVDENIIKIFKRNN